MLPSPLTCCPPAQTITLGDRFDEPILFMSANYVGRQVSYNIGDGGEGTIGAALDTGWFATQSYDPVDAVDAVAETGWHSLGLALVIPSLFIFLSRLGRSALFDRAWTTGSILLLSMQTALFTFDM
jgi:hypothetical protein